MALRPGISLSFFLFRARNSARVFFAVPQLLWLLWQSGWGLENPVQLQPDVCYNNLKPAAGAATRISCAHAPSRMGLRTLKPCKISAALPLQFCCSRFAASCHNNLKPAAGAAARISCAHAPSRMGLRTLKPCKISAALPLQFCCSRFAASCHNNLKPAAGAAARISCAHAPHIPDRAQNFFESRCPKRLLESNRKTIFRKALCRPIFFPWRFRLQWRSSSTFCIT